MITLPMSSKEPTVRRIDRLAELWRISREFNGLGEVNDLRVGPLLRICYAGNCYRATVAAVHHRRNAQAPRVGLDRLQKWLHSSLEKVASGH
jgi:hypothetical protein